MTRRVTLEAREKAKTRMADSDEWLREHASYALTRALPRAKLERP